jgi:hypothetical protein
MAEVYQIGWKFPCVGLQNIDRISLQKFELLFVRDFDIYSVYDFRIRISFCAFQTNEQRRQVCATVDFIGVPALQMFTLHYVYLRIYLIYLGTVYSHKTSFNSPTTEVRWSLRWYSKNCLRIAGNDIINMMRKISHILVGNTLQMVSISPLELSPVIVL